MRGVFSPKSFLALTSRCAHCFKHGVVAAVVGAGHQSGSSHQAGTHVAHHVPVQVGHHHDVKLLGFGHQLEHTDRVKSLGLGLVSINKKVLGCRRTCMVVLSTIMLSNLMSG